MEHTPTEEAVVVISIAVDGVALVKASLLPGKQGESPVARVGLLEGLTSEDADALMLSAAESLNKIALSGRGE